MRSHPYSQVARVVVAGLLVIAAASCSSDGPVAEKLAEVSVPDVSLPDVGAERGDGSDTDPTEPDTTDAGTSEAPDDRTETGDESAETGPSGDDGLDAATLLVLIAIAALVLLTFVYRSGKSSGQAGQDQLYQVDIRRRLDSILRSAAWADEQSSRVALTTGGGALASIQSSLASQFVEAEAECATLTVDVDDEQLRAALSRLGGAFANLRGSIAAPLGEGDEEVWRHVIEHRRIDLSHARQRVVESITSGSL